MAIALGKYRSGQFPAVGDMVKGHGLEVVAKDTNDGETRTGIVEDISPATGCVKVFGEWQYAARFDRVF